MQPVAIVTAGSHGIGAGICRKLGEAGWAVAVNYKSSRAEAEAIAGAMTKAGGRAIAVRADVTVETDIVAMFRRVDAELGPIKGLVNNAGGGKIVLGPDGARVEAMTAAHVEGIMALNFLSTVLCTREAVKRMSTRQAARASPRGWCSTPRPRRRWTASR
jgi:NAD(P)-dependent dehydrogenase (short-subunit alcohol dehydrogenase family)